MTIDTDTPDQTAPSTREPRTTGPQPPSRRRSVARLAETYGLVVFLLVAAATFSILQPELFPTRLNLANLAASQAVIAVVALGMIVPLVAGHFDFSVGAVAVLASVLLASLRFETGWPLWAACLAAICVGLVVGVINGLLVSVLHIEGLIATIGTSFIVGGIVMWQTDGRSIVGTGTDFLARLGVESTFGVPRLAIVAAVLAIGAAYLLTRTPFGRNVVAVGSNSRAAQLVGLPVRRIVLKTYVIAGFFGGVAGVLLFAQQGAGNPATDGLSLVLPAIAAVFLGASAFTPGRFNVPGTIVGLLLVAVLVSGLTLSGAEPWVRPALEGIALIVAVGMSAYFRRRHLGESLG